MVLLQDEAKAKDVAAKWAAGADWRRCSTPPTAGAPPGRPDRRDQGRIPRPELAEAAFAAPVGTVPAPVHSALGWHVLKVTAVTPGVDRPLDQVRDELRAQVLADKAADLIYDRASKIEDLLAGGTPLDDLPGDLGLAAVTGTLDAQGQHPGRQAGADPRPARPRARLWSRPPSP